MKFKAQVILKYDNLITLNYFYYKIETQFIIFVGKIVVKLNIQKFNSYSFFFSETFIFFMLIARSYNIDLMIEFYS